MTTLMIILAILNIITIEYKTKNGKCVKIYGCIIVSVMLLYYAICGYF